MLYAIGLFCSILNGFSGCLMLFFCFDGEGLHFGLDGILGDDILLD